MLSMYCITLSGWIIRACRPCLHNARDMLGSWHYTWSVFDRRHAGFNCSFGLDGTRPFNPSGLKPQSGSKPCQDQSRRESTPPVILAVTVPAEGGDWGGGNPVALASSTYCRFTSARLAPAPVRIKVGGSFFTGQPLLMFSGSAQVVAFVPLDSRHPSRPAFGGDDWGAENDGGRGIPTFGGGD